MSVIDGIIAARCTALGLTSNQAQRLAAIAAPQSLAWVLGIDIDSHTIIRPRNWLRMAAQTSSVSYRSEITAEALLSIFQTGIVPSNYFSNIHHLLDESPLQIIVMAVEQAARQSTFPIDEIWRNIERMALEMQLRRIEAWRVC